MPNRLRDFIARNIVADVPDEMDLCLSCKQASCSTREYRDCARRLERLADLRAEAQGARRDDALARDPSPPLPGP
jgi:hypothetical protein